MIKHTTRIWPAEYQGITDPMFPSQSLPPHSLTVRWNFPPFVPITSLGFTPSQFSTCEGVSPRLEQRLREEAERTDRALHDCDLLQRTGALGEGVGEIEEGGLGAVLPGGGGGLAKGLDMGGHRHAGG